MAPRLFIDPAHAPLSPGASIELPANAGRHVQVLRLQPGAPLVLFDGLGGQWSAEVADIGRRQVQARVLQHAPHEAELAVHVTLALGMPANERMDTLVEKATELGATTIQPLVTARSVLRVAGERAQRKARHWQAVAQAACEQCGRNRVPVVAEPCSLADWLARPLPNVGQGMLLSLEPQAAPLLGWLQAQMTQDALEAQEALKTLEAHSAPSLVLLSGPEGGLTPQETEAALAAAYAAVSLGPRTLRADTAPLAALAVVAAVAAGAAAGR